MNIHFYIDQAVLENYHASSALEILKDPTCDILRDMKPELKGKARDIIITAVLATDMAKHHQTIENLKKRVH
jgi:high affinity cGMP-specific 3',5'-cyclic phosphodiesterase 9